MAMPPAGPAVWHYGSIYYLQVRCYYALSRKAYLHTALWQAHGHAQVSYAQVATARSLTTKWNAAERSDRITIYKYVVLISVRVRLNL